MSFPQTEDALSFYKKKNASIYAFEHQSCQTTIDKLLKTIEDLHTASQCDEKRIQLLNECIANYERRILEKKLYPNLCSKCLGYVPWSKEEKQKAIKEEIEKLQKLLDEVK